MYFYCHKSLSIVNRQNHFYIPFSLSRNVSFHDMVRVTRKSHYNGNVPWRRGSLLLAPTVNVMVPLGLSQPCDAMSQMDRE